MSSLYFKNCNVSENYRRLEGRRRSSILCELGKKYSKDLSVNPIDIIIEEAEIEDDAKEINEHTEIQYLLLDLGSKNGLDVWAARN